MSSMCDFEFSDDTQTAGIWWSTNVAIKDACSELQSETNCSDEEVIKLLRSIANTIEREIKNND